MSTEAIDHFVVMTDIRDDFLDDTRDQLYSLLTLHQAARAGETDAAPVFQAFLHHLHSLKGQGSSFGFPSLSMIAHLLEDRLARSSPAEFGKSDELVAFVDRMAHIAETRTEPDAAALQAMLADLAAGTESADPAVAAAPGVVIVSGSGAIGQMVRAGLEERGFLAVVIRDPYEALSYIVRSQPQAVVCAAELSGLSGFDLAHCLSAMPVTRHIRTALLTSHGPGHPGVKALPDGAMVVRVGPDMTDRLAEAFRV